MTTLPLPLLLLLLLVITIIHPSFSLTLDGTLLLSFKYSILDDPSSSLSNWDYTDPTPCSWTGVTCNAPFASSSVTSLTLPNSNLVGTISQDLAFLPHLQTLDLSGNLFTGTLPPSLFNASELRLLSLSNNALSGPIPEFTTTSRLQFLNLSHNALSGIIPVSIFSLKNLTTVSLRGNRLSGGVPHGIGSIQVLDMSSNAFNGSLPVEFGGMNLNYLNVSYNNLSGPVSPLFASRIPPNATIDLSYNHLSGEIPASLANQKAETFKGNTGLCGKPVDNLCTIPSTMSNPPNDVSSVPAIAAIPKTTTASTPVPNSTTTETNGGEQIVSKQGLKRGTIAGIAVVPLAGVGLLVAIVVYVYQRRKHRNSIAKRGIRNNAINVYEYKKDPEEGSAKSLPTWACLKITNGGESSDVTNSDSDESISRSAAVDKKVIVEKNKDGERLLVMVDGETQLDFETLFKASAYVLGSSTGGGSSSGIVYKAVLQDGSALAVRRIGETGVAEMKEFENHMKAIARLRHPNVIRVRGFYWGEDEKLVISDYVSNGSLASVGYRKASSSPYHLPFETRLKIAKGVARGLNYIHEKRNVHGNIKPSNILLTPDMDPVITDLGLHRLIHGRHGHSASHGSTRHFGSYRSTSHHDDLHDHRVNNTSSPYIAPMGFIGCTSPYHAPESLKKLKPNPKWDVYSFGILLLEILTGKVFSDRELSQWNAERVGEDSSRVMRMTDVAIRSDVAVGREEAIVGWFKLGLRCASLVPQKRPSMKDAIGVLEKLPC